MGMGMDMEILSSSHTRIHSPRVLPVHPFRNNRVQDFSFTASDRGWGGGRVGRDENAVFAVLGEGGLVGLGEVDG